VSSRLATIVSILNNATLTPAPKGISPRPVPARTSPPLPYITVQEVMGREVESLSGTSGLCHAPIQVSCWSKSYEEAYALRDGVKALLLPYRGTVNGQTIQWVNHGQDRELYDDVRELHQLIEVLSIWWDS